MKDTNFPYIKLIPVFILFFIIYRIVDHIDSYLFTKINLLSIFSPFLWAFAIAYLLNPLMRFLERKFNLNRFISIIIVYFLIIGIFTFVITIITPKIVKSIGELLRELPAYFSAAEKWASNFIANFELFDRYGVTPYVERYLDDFLTQTSRYVNLILSAVVAKLINYTSTLVKMILGLLISIYMLKDKEKFVLSIKKAIYALFTVDRAKNILDLGTELDYIFSKYIIGKTIDSTIIGIICYFGLVILKAPYSILLSIIVGITNMIPYFGPFIGMIPATLITLFHSPIKALWVFLFIFLLQQFDGLYLGPKILGESVGLSPFWIILSIVVGGGLFGVLGMFLSVPVMAVITLIFHRFVDRRLTEKNIDL